MEPHPVPQDILNIEFKLFGAFSLSQFVKMVAGCLIGLFFFLLPIPSIIIKLPLVVGPIVIGVGIALVPRFAAKFENFVKALFISPRYIWVKESQSPDFLKGKKKASSKKKGATAANKNKRKYDLEEISLDRMLAAREKSPELQTNSKPVPKDQFDMVPREQNLDRVYDSLFEGVKQTNPTEQKTAQPMPASPLRQVQAGTTKDPAQQTQKTGKTPKEIQEQINILKRQLTQIVKDHQYKDKEAEILSQINDLYHDLKMMGIESVSETASRMQERPKTKSEPRPQIQTRVTDFKGAPTDEGQIVYGIVVDKKNKPIQNADVFFDLQDSENDVMVKTDSQGRFNSDRKISPGEYDISISHPGHRFHTYTIKVTDQKLPAYKLRSR